MSDLTLDKEPCKGWNGDPKSLLLIREETFDDLFFELCRVLYVEWSIYDEMMGEDVLDFRALDVHGKVVSDGVYHVRDDYLGSIGFSNQGLKVVNGDFVIPEALRACAEARDNSGYRNGFYIESLRYNPDRGVFELGMGS